MAGDDVEFVGYSPTGLERLRVLLRQANDRALAMITRLNAIDSTPGIALPGPHALHRLMRSIDEQWLPAIDTMLASTAMTAPLPDIPPELIDLAARRGLERVDMAPLSDSALVDRVRALLWLHTATGGGYARSVGTVLHDALDELRHRPAAAALLARDNTAMYTLLTADRMDHDIVSDALAAVYGVADPDRRIDLAMTVITTAAAERLNAAGRELAIHTVVPLLASAAPSVDRGVITVPLPGVDGATTVLCSRAEMVAVLAQLLDTDRGRTAIGLAVGDATQMRLTAALEVRSDDLDPVDVVGAYLAPMADVIALITDAVREQAQIVSVQSAAAISGTRQGLGYLAALSTASHPVSAIAVRALPLALDPVVSLLSEVDTAPAAAAAAIAAATTISIVRILIEQPHLRHRLGLGSVSASTWASLSHAVNHVDHADELDDRDRALADLDRLLDADPHLATYVARVTTTASLTWG